LKVVRKNRYPKSIGGELYVNGKKICYTLELPWRWNQKDISCIPPGKYSCWWRYDRGRIQVKDIPCPGGYRTGVQFHGGKTTGINPSSGKPTTRGCILVGTSIREDYVEDSPIALRLLEEAIFGPELGPGYKFKPMMLVIEGVLQDSRYDLGVGIQGWDFA
jgi:hypothetical protein